MTPKEKAKKLFQFYLPYVQSSNYIEEIKDNCKKCALIAVDEILEITEHESPSTYVYYKEVKQEIEAL